MLPSLEVLEKISKKIKYIPNRQGEYKRKTHYCCFLLGYKSGLRISEAVRFDLSAKNKQGLYRINKPKGKKERFVYVSPSVINELKANNWQPNQTNRHNFYHFLKKTKQELNISKETELTPHTLRRSFTTHHANSGVPLPLLQKLLGHSSIRTTALYWRDTDEDGNHDTPDILQVKNWLEKQEPPTPPSTENFPEQPLTNSEPVIIPKIPSIPKGEKPLIPVQKPTNQDNLLLNNREQGKKSAIANYQPKPPASQIQPKPSEKIFLIIDDKKQPEPEISQPLALITSQKEPPTVQEQILLIKIKQLEEQLKQVQVENSNLTTKLAQTKAIATQEKKRADNYQQQLKTIAKTLYQLQKANYYKQLERERTEIEAKIIQSPPWKSSK